jgi:hypothetical protein
MARKLCAIIGFGPGLGAAYAEVFRVAGYDLALVSRSGTGTLQGRHASLGLGRKLPTFGFVQPSRRPDPDDVPVAAVHHVENLSRPPSEPVA